MRQLETVIKQYLSTTNSAWEFSVGFGETAGVLEDSREAVHLTTGSDGIEKGRG